jgi:hypothetical protein
MTTNSTLNGATLQTEDETIRIIEAKIVARYRHMEATAGRQGRPFLLVIQVDGGRVSFFDGHPAGRMVQDE